MAVFVTGVSPAVAANPSSDTAEEAVEDDGRPNKRGFSDSFNGAFVAPGSRGAFSGGSGWNGWSVDAGLRHSFPFMLGDVRLSYRHDALEGEFGSTPGTIRQHGVGVHVGVHPLFMLMLGSDWLSYFLSSPYVEIGLGGQYALAGVSTPAQMANLDGASDFGFFWSIGGGVDMPLWDPDAGSALWLNVLYRYHGGGADLAGRTVDLDLHSAFVGLEWRINGVLF